MYCTYVFHVPHYDLCFGQKRIVNYESVLIKPYFLFAITILLQEFKVRP